MSQSASPHTQRPVAGMIGAMIVAVVVAGGWYLIGRPNEDVQAIQPVEWKPQVQAARADQALLVYAPDELPDGWKPRSVSYLTGSDPHWHLGLLTPVGKYVGIDEGRVPVPDLVATYVDKNASQGKDVTIAGKVWQTWTDTGGDYAVTRTLKQGQFTVDSVIVVGTAGATEIDGFVASLKIGALRQSG